MLKLTKTSQDFDGIESFYEFNGQKALKFGHCEKKNMCVLSLYTFFSGKKWKSESGNCRMSSRNVANYNDLS